MVGFRRLTLAARLDRIASRLPPPIDPTAADRKAREAELDGLSDAELDDNLARILDRLDRDPAHVAFAAEIETWPVERIEALLHDFSIHPSQRGKPYVDSHRSGRGRRVRRQPPSRA